MSNLPVSPLRVLGYSAVVALAGVSAISHYQVAEAKTQAFARESTILDTTKRESAVLKPYFSRHTVILDTAVDGLTDTPESKARESSTLHPMFVDAEGEADQQRSAQNSARLTELEIAHEAPHPAPGATHLAAQDSLADPSSVSSIGSAASQDQPATRAESLELDDPQAVTVLVNKDRPLDPVDFVPQNLVPLSVASSSGNLQLHAAAASAAKELFVAAAADGVNLVAESAYRSYSNQKQTHDHWVATYGKQNAEMISARPGYSEHQTGFALDVSDGNANCRLKTCFGDTVAGQWLAKNAHHHGWVIRYTEGDEAVTGYNYEPWHLRYLGVELATEVYESGQPYETFLGVDN